MHVKGASAAHCAGTPNELGLATASVRALASHANAVAPRVRNACALRLKAGSENAVTPSSVIASRRSLDAAACGEPAGVCVRDDAGAGSNTTWIAGMGARLTVPPAREICSRQS